jgi:CubicO group peptidase (beta-lactamase class C family)
MTSGLTYDDESLPYTNPANDMYRFFTADDPIRFLLAKPLFAEPGTVFDYDNCNTNIFGHIIGKVANKRLDVFAKEYLFDKIGVTRQEWQTVRNDVVFCSGDLHLRPRDMAKFGQLFLNRGEWNAERIISSGWCDISTTAVLNPNNYTAEFPWADGYGYHWWHKTFVRPAGNLAAYFAFGWGGQMIMIIPDLSLVIVTTAGNWFEAEKISPFSIVSEYIIPSVNR